MASDDKHEENLELLKGLNLPKKVRDKMPTRPGLHVGCKLPLHATGCKDWKPENEYDYPLTNSGPLCQAEESGHLDSVDVLCPFSDDGKCTGDCPSNRERMCILGED